MRFKVDESLHVEGNLGLASKFNFQTLPAKPFAPSRKRTKNICANTPQMDAI